MSLRSRQFAILSTLILFAVCLGALPRTAHADGTPTPTPQPTFSSTPVTLTITGTVSVGTAGITAPAGLSIILHIVHSDADGKLNETLSRSVPMAADNSFSFQAIPAVPGDLAFTTTVYENVTQGSAIFQVANGQTALTLPIVLYAATSDVTLISLVRVRHILEPRPDKLVQVLASYTFKSEGDRLYLSTDKTSTGKPVSVKIPLPVGARAVAFNNQAAEQARFFLGGDPNFPVVQDTKPVLPGQTHEIVFSYQLPFDQSAPIDQDYPYNTQALEVLIPEKAGLRLTNGNFEVGTDTSAGAGKTFIQYTLKAPIKAGERLVYTVSTGNEPIPAAAPKSTSGGGLSATLLTIGIILGLLVAAVAALFGVRQVLRQRASRHN